MKHGLSKIIIISLFSLIFPFTVVFDFPKETQSFNTFRNLLFSSSQTFNQPSSVFSITPTTSFTATGTPMPVQNNPADLIKNNSIGINNVESIKIIGRSVTNNNSIKVGKESSHWGVLTETGLEFHEMGTNNLIWKAELSPNLLISTNGDFVFGFDNTNYQVQGEKDQKQVFTLPKIKDKDKGSVFIQANFQKKLMIIGINTPFYYLGPQIPAMVYQWGEQKPLYSLNGFNFSFSMNEEYLSYQQGSNLVMIEAESGKSVTEFGLNNENAYWKTSWDDKYLAFSRRGSVEIWRISDRKMIRTLKIDSGQSGEVYEFAFSPNNEFIIVIKPGMSVNTWSIETGDLVNEESTKDVNLNSMSVSDEGKIIFHNFPDLRGRNWKYPFDTYSNFIFSPEGNSLHFTTGLVNTDVDDKEICQWDLKNKASCQNGRFWTWNMPSRAKILGLGSDGFQYFIKPFSSNEIFGLGWGKEEKVIKQIPKLSESTGLLRQFYYDDSSKILFIQYIVVNDGFDYDNEDTFSSDLKSVFLYNRKTNARLLTSGRINRFIGSRDGKYIYEINTLTDSENEFELIGYDSETLKVESHTPLKLDSSSGKDLQTSEKKKPEVLSMAISADGSVLYSLLMVSSGEIKFIIIPVNNQNDMKSVDLDIPSGHLTNMLLSKTGDLAIFAEYSTGNLDFVNVLTGELVKSFPVEGNPVQIAINPVGNMIAIADKEKGINLVGLQINNSPLSTY